MIVSPFTCCSMVAESTTQGADVRGLLVTPTKKLPRSLVVRGGGSGSCSGLYLDFEAEVTETGDEAADGGLFVLA
ncbi:MAG: hypothetical protein ACHQPI_14850, partial [Thermoanaerobaculia bacterium]